MVSSLCSLRANLHATSPFVASQTDAESNRISAIFATALSSFHDLKELKNSFQAIEGAFWSICWISLFYNFTQQIHKLAEIANRELPPEEYRSRMWEEGSEAGRCFVGLVGITASLAKWADSVQWLALGKYVLWAQKISYFSYLATSILGIQKSVTGIMREGSTLSVSLLSSIERVNHEHLYTQNAIDLAYHLSTSAWSALGLIELAGMAVYPLLMMALLLMNCVLLVYSGYFASRRSREAAYASNQMQSGSANA